jgi:hypothetical protein
MVLFRLKSASRKARLPWLPSAVGEASKERKERREEKKMRKGGKPDLTCLLQSIQEYGEPIIMIFILKKTRTHTGQEVFLSINF